jgi:hypothetical protein
MTLHVGFDLSGYRQIKGKASAVQRRVLLAVLPIAAAFGAVTPEVVARVHAAPAPEIEYTYDVTVRRHYNWPADTDPVSYGHSICDKVTQGASYAQVMGDVKNDVTPNDEFAANYLVSYAVNFLCPEQLWQLRRSAAFYVPPPQ